MPSKSKSEARFRSRSRSRSRSRGRSKSPSRTKAKKSPSPARKTKSTPKKQITRSPTTPTRQSARIRDIVEKQDIEQEIKQQASQNDKGDNASVSKRSTKEKAAAAPSKYELIGGPVAAFVLTFSLPALVLGLAVACEEKNCKLDKFPVFPKKLSAYFDREVPLLLLGFVLLQAVLASLPIGGVGKGPASKSGKSRTYRFNGFVSLLITLGLIAAVLYFKGSRIITNIYSKKLPVVTLRTVGAFFLAAFLYYRSAKLKAHEKSETGSFVYDFCMGREVNPHIGHLNLKLFCLRLAATTWVLITMASATKAYTEGTLTPALGCVLLFQGVYVADMLFYEDTFLTTFEFAHAGFGLMSSIVYLVYLPVVYSLQTRYLLEHPREWHSACLAGFVILNLVGYVIYRGSNSEKDRFRRDPHNPMFANFKQIPTPSGKKLLASGWWGLCRHPNYLGNIIMCLAWSLPSGFASVMPYVCPILLVLTLLERGIRDDALCRKKYGAAWDRYCREVKYRLIPYVY